MKYSTGSIILLCWSSHWVLDLKFVCSPLCHIRFYLLEAFMWQIIKGSSLPWPVSQILQLLTKDCIPALYQDVPHRERANWYHSVDQGSWHISPLFLLALGTTNRTLGTPQRCQNAKTLFVVLLGSPAPYLINFGSHKCQRLSNCSFSISISLMERVHVIVWYSS